MRSKISLSTRDCSAAGFTLIEIVLAVGVISFALVAILGLFPVALQTATNSQRETQAALVARSIFTDLESQSGDKRYILLGQDPTPIADAASGQQSSRYSDKYKKVVDLTKAGNYYLAYDADGLPLSDSIGEGEYSSGDHKAVFLAQVKVIAPTDPPGIGITQVEVTVGAPAAAAEKNRTTYLFVSLLNNGQKTTIP